MFFKNKSALVTGGAGAIGGAICEDLLKSGVTNLAVLDIHKDEPKIVKDWAKAFPNAAIKYFPVNVGSPEELKKCYETFTKGIKSLDIVANCAGILNENDYKTTIDVNLGGVVGSTLLAIDYMRKDTGKGQGGVILNISSVAGLGLFSPLPTYCATKFGIIAFTRSAAYNRDYLGIKFLTLCPAGTQSAIYDKIKDGTKHFFMSTQEQVDYINATYPVQSPAEVAKGALKVIEEAPNSTVWMIDVGKLTQITDLTSIAM